MKLKKTDKWLILLVLVIAAACFLVYRGLGMQQGDMVQIEVAGEVFGTYSLMEENEIQIYDTNILLIRKGKVFMKEADCPDQICVKHKEIYRNGETIVCLPNKVIVKISAAQDNTIDAVTD